MRRFVFPAVILGIIIALGTLVAWRTDGDWDRDDHVQTVQIQNPDGSTSPAQAIVIEDNDHRGGFFPFGLLFFPLMILLVIGIVRAVFGGRGGPWNGPGGWGGPGRYGPGPDPAWLDDWHKRQHTGSNEASTPPAAPAS